jgi:2Fe-2S ferredoxin
MPRRVRILLDLKGRKLHKEVESIIGQTILDIALKNDIDWDFSCTRGTCARCRCLVVTGKEHLGEVTDEEWDRLDDEELEQGYRLGCQAVVRTDDLIVAINKPYF